MMNGATEATRHRSARVAGLMYLFSLATALFASYYVRASLVVWGDVAATMSNFRASEQLLRIGLASDLLSFAGIVVLALALWVVLRPVAPHLALLALFWWLGEAFILAAITLADYVALIFSGDAAYLSAFDAGQLQALVRVFVEAHLTGYNIGLVFFGLGSTIFSYLLYRSRYVPRALAALGVFASLVITVGTLAILVVPAHEDLLYQLASPPIALYELLIGLWLLVRGIDATVQGDSPNVPTA